MNTKYTNYTRATTISIPMKIEHFALNVPDPVAMADWYVTNLGMSIVRQQKEPPYMTFLADDSGQVMIEIYHNPAAKVPDYKNQDPLIVHLAFVTLDPKGDKLRLQKAGAREESDDITEAGDHLIMLRDPWGIPIQLCKRS